MSNLPTEPTTFHDPYQWLEEVDSARALDWVRAQNQKTDTRLAQSDSFKALQAELLAVLDSDSNIPFVEKSARTITTSGLTPPTHVDCGVAPRWRSTARSNPPGKLCWTSTR